MFSKFAPVQNRHRDSNMLRGRYVGDNGEDTSLNRVGLDVSVWGDGSWWIISIAMADVRTSARVRAIGA